MAKYLFFISLWTQAIQHVRFRLCIIRPKINFYIICECLKPLLDKVIKPNQLAELLNRKLHESITIKGDKSEMKKVRMKQCFARCGKPRQNGKTHWTQVPCRGKLIPFSTDRKQKKSETGRSFVGDALPTTNRALESSNRIDDTYQKRWKTESRISRRWFCFCDANRLNMNFDNKILQKCRLCSLPGGNERLVDSQVWENHSTNLSEEIVFASEKS